MCSELKESHESQSSKKIAELLKQQGSVVVSPINLTVETTRPLHIRQLQWDNFYEPPLKLTLRNSGDTVTVQGRWPHNRPALSGGPLSGPYVFSHIHFHWDAESHRYNRHTINGKSNALEMHVLFYKSSYRNQVEAQEKEDGVLMVVYFFKVDKESSLKWMTDYLRFVTTKATKTLPAVPLSSLLVPFSRDYLVYRGALPCNCHHVLWLVSRNVMRITVDELKQFNKIQSDMREKVNNRVIKAETSAYNVYSINPSSDINEVLFDEPLDPPSQVMPKGNSIGLITNIAYPPARTIANPPTAIKPPAVPDLPVSANSPEPDNLPVCANSPEPDNLPVKSTSPSVSDPPAMMNSPAPPKKYFLNRDNNYFDGKSILKTSSVDSLQAKGKDKGKRILKPFQTDSPLSETNDQCQCSVCDNSTTYTEIRHYHKSSTHECIFVSKSKEVLCSLQSKRTENIEKNAFFESERSKSETKIQMLECSEREIVEAKRMLEKTDNDINNVVNAFENRFDEYDRVSLMHNSKENSLINDAVVDDENNNTLKRYKNIRSVLTSKPSTPRQNQKQLQCEEKGTETNTKSDCKQHGDFPTNRESKTSRNETEAKRGKEIKKRVEMIYRHTRAPVETNPPKEDKIELKSTLEGIFRCKKENKTTADKEPETAIVNRAINKQRKDLEVKSNFCSRSAKRVTRVRK